MKRRAIETVIVLLVLMPFAGCDGDSGTQDPDAQDPGVIVIEIEPDLIGASWELAGPGSIHGSGGVDSVMTDMPPGQYTITWSTVAGWIAPAGGEQTLLPEDMLVFGGFYTEEGFTPRDHVLVLGGNFVMGSPLNEIGATTDEHPQHTVHLSRGFFMQSTEVTNQQYLEMAQWAINNGHATPTDTILYDAMDGEEEILLWMGDSASEIVWEDGVLKLREVPGHGLNPDHPAHHVTWFGAAAYCDWLNLKMGLYRVYDHENWECNEHEPYDAYGWRLPTEAEWERACRAGSSTAFANGPITERFCDFDPVLDEIGWYCGNDAEFWPHAGGEKTPNALGLYDMHGNVVEWCNDWYRDDEYSGHGDGAVDPAGPRNGFRWRVCRGGTYRYAAESCRSAARDSYFNSSSDRHMGFRPVMSHWGFHLP